MHIKTNESYPMLSHVSRHRNICLLGSCGNNALEVLKVALEIYIIKDFHTYNV